MKVVWARPALVALDAFLERLDPASPISRHAKNDIVTQVERLGRFPLLGRKARWAGYREWSILKWRKIAVYQVEADHILIVAILDARQDLSDWRPENES